MCFLYVSFVDAGFVDTVEASLHIERTGTQLISRPFTSGVKDISAFFKEKSEVKRVIHRMVTKW